MDATPIQTKADPTTDLPGCMLEVISAVKRMSTQDTAHNGQRSNTAKLPVTSTPVVDCNYLIRDDVIPSPLYRSGSFSTTWTVGELSGHRALAVGVDRDKDDLWTSVFNARRQTWTEPALITALEGRAGAVKYPVVARGADQLVAYIGTELVVFAIHDDGTLKQLASCGVSTHVELLAVTEDGTLVAAIMDGSAEMWLFRHTPQCLSLCQTVPSAGDHRMRALAFSPDGTRLAISDEHNAVHLCPIDASELAPMGSAVARVGMMPSESDVLAHYANSEHVHTKDTDEPAQWVTLGASGALTLATKHHLSVVQNSSRYFIGDNVSALSVLVHPNFYTVLDSSGRITLFDYSGNTRQVITPDENTADKQPLFDAPVCCESCLMRTKHMPTAVCHPVIWLCDGERTLIVVDQWSVARVAISSAD